VTAKTALLIMFVMWTVRCSSVAEPAPVTPRSDISHDLVLSPDGTKSIYSATISDGSEQLFLADADGRQPVQITFDGLRNHSPDWSPCGRLVLFVSDRDGDAEIFIMDADGSHQRQLTFNDHWDGQPTWSADGRQILFACKSGEDVEKFAITDGAGTFKLVDDRTQD
jgi:TolB protein